VITIQPSNLFPTPTRLKEVFNAFLDAVVIDTVGHLPGVSRANRDKVEVAVWDMVNAMLST
jgi:hypothetical protein